MSGHFRAFRKGDFYNYGELLIIKRSCTKLFNADKILST